MESFVTAIIVVFGLLQLILFFKIWGMTNDVNKIKNFLISKIEEKEGFSKFSEGDIVIHAKTGKVMTIKKFDYKTNKYLCYSDDGIYEGSYKEAELDIYVV
ncbi:MAG: hypothetical protein LBV71_13200 [Prevotella sp.]|jgi:hypothetical protein|nr:hypothetical protein [Prevotella sp.]